MPDQIPYRQIHLDFHTNEEIPGVGDHFDRDEFLKTLQLGHVNSINLFAKCHHGMYYYPTKIGKMHPSLKFDLFGEQVKVCKENGIRVGAYTCVAWSEDEARRHPEWLVYTYDGLRGGLKPFENHFTRWNTLCIANPQYREVLKAEFKEIYEGYKPDGYWIDIVMGFECVCETCQASMRALGLDPANRADVRRHDRIKETAFCRDIYRYMKDIDPKIELYFNSMPYSLDDGRDGQASSVEKRKYFSFVDIESLPSDAWGYNHFPIAANYIGKYPMEICMMNGKFHFSWADFGTMRNLEALEYECFRAIAYGAKICVGDQLHPSGRLDPVVYSRIGEVFKSVEEKEPWLHGTKKLCEVGAFITTSAVDGETGSLTEEGVYQVLSELHIPFDFLNCHDDIDRYKLLILPDKFDPPEELSARIDRFMSRGGKVLITGRSGADAQSGEYSLLSVMARYEGESAFDNRYIRLDAERFQGVPAIDHVTYEKGYVVSPHEGEEVIARVVVPYFNRTYNRFSSHRQTPPTLTPSDEAAIIKGEGYILISSPLFADYANSRYQAHREMLRACIDMLMDEPLVQTDLPSISEVTVREKEESYILHVLNYVIARKAKRLDTIEERFLVKDAHIALRVDAKPSKVLAAPCMEPLAFEYDGGYVKIDLHEISGHTMIEVRK